MNAKWFGILSMTLLLMAGGALATTRTWQLGSGADVILLPEIQYDIHAVADFLQARRQSGMRLSIIAVAEGATAIGEPGGEDEDNVDDDTGDAKSGGKNGRMNGKNGDKPALHRLMGTCFGDA